MYCRVAFVKIIFPVANASVRTASLFCDPDRVHSSQLVDFCFGRGCESSEVIHGAFTSSIEAVGRQRFSLRAVVAAT